MNIRQKMALIVITSILVIALPGTALIYKFVEHKNLSSEIVTLEKITERLNNNATQRFSHSKPKLETLAKLLEKELKKPIQKQELAEFHKTIERNADGVWRNKKTEFNGKLEAGVFLPTNPYESDLQKIRHLRIKKVLDTFGAAANKNLENVWFLSPHRSEIIFDKNLPDFAFEQKADNDYTSTPWFTYATPTENPNRELRFTPPLFDPVPKIWMVSAVYPLYVGDEFIGSLGEDMPLTGTLEFMFESEQLYSNTQHFLIDTQQGNFVLAGAWQKQLEALPENTKLNFGDNEQALLNLFKLKPTNKPRLLVDNLIIDKQRFVAIGMMIQPLNWHYYKLVPIDKILEPMHELFSVLTGMILFISGLSGFLIFVATGQSITKRIKILTDVINHYANDHSLRLNHQLAGSDEIAQAGLSFDKMANEIEQNITDKIKAEETLVHKEELLRFALEGSGDGVWDWNVETNDVVFSERWKTMLGYETDELKNGFLTFEMLLHPDDKQRVMATVQAYFKNEIENYAIEFRFRCKDGSYKWILARAALANRNKNGEPLRMVGTHTDISKSKELEARLRTLTVAIEQSPTSIVITDLEANLIYVNPQFTRVTGYNSTEVLGINPRVLQSGLTSKETYLDLWNTVTQGQVWRGELKNRRKNGEIYYEEAHIAPVFNENNEIIQYVGVKFDVTERKKNETAIFNLNHDLQCEKQFSDSILNGLPTIFYMIDMTGKIMRWNPNFEKVTGYSYEEMVCFDSALTFIAQDDRELIKTAIEEVFNGGSASVEAGFLTKDGTIIPYYFIGERMLLDECFYLIGIGEDITERKKTEKILIESKEAAEAATKAKSIFLANMSHEFRTPMNAIMGFSQLALSKDISPEIRNYLEKIKTASDGLLAVLNDILDFS